jgi:hypothetical protein
VGAEGGRELSSMVVGNGDGRILMFLGGCVGSMAVRSKCDLFVSKDGLDNGGTWSESRTSSQRADQFSTASGSAEKGE